AQKLGSPEGKPGIVRVAIQSNVDALIEELKFSERHDTRWADRVFEFAARFTGKSYPRDARKEPLKKLRETAIYVEDELYEKLTNFGTPVAKKKKPGGVGKESLFENPASKEHEPISQLGATHILFADVQAPQDGGQYHLAMRLVDVV